MKRLAAYAGWLAVVFAATALFCYMVFPDKSFLVITLAMIAFGNGLFFVLVDWNSIRAALKTRTALYGFNTAVLTTVVVGILIFLNLISYRHKHRIDMTAQGYFTLSPQTQKIASTLPREVKVTAFFQTEAPDKAKFKHLVDGYTSLSDKITLTFVDPDKSPSITKQYGITTYGTIVLESGKQEAKVPNPNEENLTNAFLKVVTDRKKTVSFLEGHGEKSIDSLDKEGYSTVKKALEKDNYQIGKLLLMQSGEVPKDVSLLIINGPKKPIMDKEQVIIEKYLEQGGSVLLLIDPQSDYGMEGLLKKWGIESRNNMVIDPMSKLFGGDFAAPVVNQYGFHDITKDFALATIFPLVRPVTALPAEGVETLELMKTGQGSWGESDVSASKVKYDEGVDMKGPVPIAVIATRKTPPPTSDKGDEKIEKNKKPTLAVIGDSDFANNTYFGFSGNGDLFLNTVSWLSQNDQLISIRPRERKNNPIHLSQTEGSLIFMFGIIVFPAAILLAGVGIWWRRRAL
jgi:ABC-type uncharacterized transport system involved in gliding motility auxiliary subunit